MNATQELRLAEIEQRIRERAMLFGVCFAADQLLAVLVNGQVAGRPVPGEAVDRPETFLRLHHSPHVQIYVAGPDRAQVMAGGELESLGCSHSGGSQGPEPGLSRGSGTQQASSSARRGATYRAHTVVAQSRYHQRMPAQLDTGGDAFGDRLRSLRERAGLTQEELANRAALTPNAVSALERGTRTRPYPHTVRSLADALNLSDSERAALIGAVPKRRNMRSEPEAPQGPRSDWVNGADAELNLVVPPTPLFGRDGDITTIAQLARSRRSRLLTLTGPGGVGKTRLAMAVCQELVEDYPDGVFPISLAALAEADDVVGTIAHALKLAAPEGAAGISLLTQHLNQRRLLLVLDNFEHLLSAAADVGRLVANCGNLTVLVTSRSPLRVRGEQEYVVDPLTLPAPTWYRSTPWRAPPPAPSCSTKPSRCRT